MESFLAHSGEVQLHMSHFFLRYLSTIYHAFGSDMLLAWILGEIAHHNTTRYFSSHSIDRAALHELMSHPGRWDELEGCNAFSLSQSTGIPRETIRRKVKQLIDKGWVENVRGNGLRITPKCSQQLRPEVSVRVLDLLLGVAETIRSVMKEPVGGGVSEGASGSGVAT